MSGKTIILDFETSGLNPYHDDIIEIGAKILGEDNIFTMLVKPKSGNLICKKITDITNITNRMIMNEGKSWEISYIAFYNWLIENLDKNNPNLIVSHNGTTFDFIFLEKLLFHLNENSHDIEELKKFNIHYIDTLLLSRKLLPSRTYYNQKSLCNSYNIDIIQEHRALGDVLCLEKIYMKLYQKGKFKNNDDVYNYLNYIL